LDNLQCRGFDDIASMIEQKDAQLSELSASLQKQESKFKRHVQVHRLLKSRVRESSNAAKGAFEEQQKQNEVLTAELERLRAESHSQKGEIVQLLEKVDRISREYDDRLTEARSKHSSFVTQIHADVDRERRELSAQISQKNAELDELASQNHKLEHGLSQWRRTAELMKKAKRERESELNALAAQFDDSKAEWTDRLERERDCLRSQYEELLLTIKSKNKELRGLASKSNELLEDLDARNRELMHQRGEAEKSNQHLKQQLQSQQETIDREKQLIENRAKGLNMQFDLKCQQLVEELKAGHEEEIRKIYGFIVKSFKRFFDGRQKLGEECVKSIIEKATVECERLHQGDLTIRRLLGLSASESTEEAVARLLLAAHGQPL
jgi:translation elongation factor EF-G